MNKLKLILLVAIFSLPVVSLAEDVEFKIQYAIRQMDNGKIDESKSILEDILLKDPKHYVANYEMAYLLNMTGQYDEALKYLDKIKKSKERTDQYYQLLGTVYDYKGDQAKSIKAFKDGLKKFPKSGLLHVELGMMYQKAEDNLKALECYENGILADPMFPSNYLRAALLLMTSSEPVWGLMYGEIFMNLEPDTHRSLTVGQYMYEVLKSKTEMSDSGFKANLTNSSNIEFDSKTFKLYMPFPLFYQTNYQVAGKKAIEDRMDNLGLSALAKIHEYQMTFGKESYKEEYNDPLFEYIMKIQDAGFMEEYCMSLYKSGDRAGFDEWLSTHKDRYDKFLEWRRSNKLQLTPSHCFSRLTCAPVPLH